MNIPKPSDLNDDGKNWIVLMEQLRETNPDIVIEWVRNGLSFPKEEATDNLMASLAGLGVAITASEKEQLAYLQQVPLVRDAIRNILDCVYEIADEKDRKVERESQR